MTKPAFFSAILTVASDEIGDDARKWIPREGVPGPSARVMSIDEWKDFMLGHVAAGCGVDRRSLVRPTEPKTCISCGALQSVDGSLPCGH